MALIHQPGLGRPKRDHSAMTHLQAEHNYSIGPAMVISLAEFWSLFCVHDGKSVVIELVMQNSLSTGLASLM